MVSDAFSEHTRGSPWETTGALLREVFRDLQRPALQEWMIRAPALVDVQFLTANANLSRSQSFTAWTDSPTPSNAEVSANLIVPTHTVDGFAAGVSVESYTPSRDVVKNFGGTDHVLRFIINAQQERTLSMAMDERSNTVLVRFHAKAATGYVGAMLLLKHDAFLDAFGASIDLGALERALQWSCATAAQPGAFSRRPQCDTGPVLKGEACPSVYAFYTLPSNVEMKTYSSFHKDGVQLVQLEDRMVVCHNRGTHYGIVDYLKDFAVRSRMNGVPPVPQNLIPNVVGRVRGDAQCFDSQRSEPLIAPAPADSADTQTMSYAQLLDMKRKQKEEKRRIQNRAAAARSNAKRSEARRKASNKAVVAAVD